MGYYHLIYQSLPIAANTASTLNSPPPSQDCVCLPLTPANGESIDTQVGRHLRRHRRDLPSHHIISTGPATAISDLDELACVIQFLSYV